MCFHFKITLSNAKIYLDGVLLTNIESSSNPTTIINTVAGQDFKLGLHDINPSARWHGDIDAVHWFNDELSLGVVSLLYNGGEGIEISGPQSSSINIIKLRRSGY